MLLGFLSRVVLEGYLSSSWKGVPPVRCLLFFGLGINENVGQKDNEEEESDRPNDDSEAEFATRGIGIMMLAGLGRRTGCALREEGKLLVASLFPWD